MKQDKDLEVINSIAEVSSYAKKVLTEQESNNEVLPYLILANLTKHLESKHKIDNEIKNTVKVLNSYYKNSQKSNSDVNMLIDLAFIDSLSPPDEKQITLKIIKLLSKDLEYRYNQTFNVEPVNLTTKDKARMVDIEDLKGADRLFIRNVQNAKTDKFIRRVHDYYPDLHYPIALTTIHIATGLIMLYTADRQVVWYESMGVAFGIAVFMQWITYTMYLFLKYRVVLSNTSYAYGSRSKFGKLISIGLLTFYVVFYIVLVVASITISTRPM